MSEIKKMKSWQSVLLCVWLKALIFLSSPDSFCLFQTASTSRAFVTATATPAADTAADASNAAPSVGKLRSSAEVFFSKGELDKSIDMWAKVIAMEPENETNYYKRFRVYLRQQKLKEALSDLSTTLKINPKHDNALVQRAKLHMRLGKCAEAEADYELLRK